MIAEITKSILSLILSYASAVLSVLLYTKDKPFLAVIAVLLFIFLSVTKIEVVVREEDVPFSDEEINEVIGKIFEEMEASGLDPENPEDLEKIKKEIKEKTGVIIEKIDIKK